MAQFIVPIATCHVCLDQALRGFRLECQHEYCSGCMYETLIRAVRDASHLPRKCCDIPINMALPRVLLNKVTADILQAKTDELLAEKKMYCPACSQFINLDLVDSSAHKIWRCLCANRVCVECRTNEHPGLSCLENQAAVRGCNQLVIQLGERRGWKRCPHCRTMIELTEGCNHMTCISCLQQFCFRCLRDWRTCCNGRCT